MRPTELACRHVDYTLDGDEVNCGAEAGEPCRWMAADPARPGMCHSERILDAAAFD